MANLASVFYSQCRWAEAGELFVPVMETRKGILGQEHPDTLSSMEALASMYANQMRYKEAEELQMQLMNIHQTTLGEDHPFTASGIDYLVLIRKNREESQRQSGENRF